VSRIESPAFVRGFFRPQITRMNTNWLFASLTMDCSQMNTEKHKLMHSTNCSNANELVRIGGSL